MDIYTLSGAESFLICRIFLVVFLILSCSKKNDNGHYSGIEYQYDESSTCSEGQVWSYTRSSCIADCKALEYPGTSGEECLEALKIPIRKESILEDLITDGFGDKKVCINIEDDSVYNGHLERIKEDVRKSLYLWTDPLEQLGVGIKSDLVFYINKCPEYMRLMQVNIVSPYATYITNKHTGKHRAHARPYERIIVISVEDKFSTILHEIGHLLGLPDLYIEKENNEKPVSQYYLRCREKFPKSVMCMSKDELYEADKQAIISQYCLQNSTNESCRKYLPKNFKELFEINNSLLDNTRIFTCFDKEKRMMVEQQVSFRDFSNLDGKIMSKQLAMSFTNLRKIKTVKIKKEKWRGLKRVTESINHDISYRFNWMNSSGVSNIEETYLQVKSRDPKKEEWEREPSITQEKMISGKSIFLDEKENKLKMTVLDKEVNKELNLDFSLKAIDGDCTFNEELKDLLREMEGFEDWKFDNLPSSDPFKPYEPFLELFNNPN